jgi:hypothetical protein
MNLFDSATVENRKKRNQKKPVVVLESMLASSRATKPAEISYHADGSFRKSRDVFGPISEDEFTPPVLNTPLLHTNLLKQQRQNPLRRSRVVAKQTLELMFPQMCLVISATMLLVSQEDVSLLILQAL